MRFLRSGLVIVDQEDEDETNENNSRGRNNRIEYENYGSDDESEVPTESSARMIKK